MPKKGTIHKRTEFRFQSAKDETSSGDKPITVRELAVELGVLPERILALMAESYLTVLKEKMPREETVIRKPRSAGLEWLRSALGPVPFVPVIKLDHACKALGLRPYDMRRLVMEYNVHLHIDPALGELMTVAGFYAIVNNAYPQYEWHRFDRQMFFAVLSGLASGEPADPNRPMGFDERLEMELARILKLPLAQRDLRTMDVYSAWRDAKTLAGLLTKVLRKESPVALRVNAIMHDWKRTHNMALKALGAESTRPDLPARQKSPQQPKEHPAPTKTRHQQDSPPVETERTSPPQSL